MPSGTWVDLAPYGARIEVMHDGRRNREIAVNHDGTITVVNAGWWSIRTPMPTPKRGA